MTQTCAQQALVTLSGISKAFDGKSVVADFDLTIGHGEFVTLLGPSGCGKTTILRLIAGLENTDQGQVTLDGQDITHLPAEKRHINTVFQSYALFPHMNVFDNVAFGLRMQKPPAAEIKQRVNEALTMVRLQEFADRKPSQLSGGQQQRVAIARAVVNRPKVLLLDESLSALDYKLRKQMQNELKALQRKLGITFIFVTHDQEEALTMSDRIVVLRDGKIEQVEISGCEYQVHCPFPVSEGDRVNVLLRPEDLRIDEVQNAGSAQGLTGYIRERNYKGSTLESVVELDNGQSITVSEFFNEDDPDFDYLLNQKVTVSWVNHWEVVLPYEADA